MDLLMAVESAREPTTERKKRVRDARDGDAIPYGPDASPRGEFSKGPAVTSFDSLESPLPAVTQAHPQGHEMGAASAAAVVQSTPDSPVRARRVRADARPMEQQMEPVHRNGPLHQLIKSGIDEMENQAGNRFGGSEICPSCEQSHADANYVATDANGVSYCGECWDTALGVTLLVKCAFAPGDHRCSCGNDLRTEQWFAVEDTPGQQAYCQACSLSFWGFTNADMMVSAVKDGGIDHVAQARGAHLRSSPMKPYDDASPPAGLSDRGFSRGLVPRWLESCMNLSPKPGAQVPTVMRTDAECACNAAACDMACIMITRRTGRGELTPSHADRSRARRPVHGSGCAAAGAARRSHRTSSARQRVRSHVRWRRPTAHTERRSRSTRAQHDANHRRGRATRSREAGAARHARDRQRPRDTFATGRGRATRSRQAEAARHVRDRQGPRDPLATGRGRATRSRQAEAARHARDRQRPRDTLAGSTQAHTVGCAARGGAADACTAQREPPRRHPHGTGGRKVGWLSQRTKSEPPHPMWMMVQSCHVVLAQYRHTLDSCSCITHSMHLGVQRRVVGAATHALPHNAHDYSACSFAVRGICERR